MDQVRVQYEGKLIDGTDSSIDSGERSIEVRFQVVVDPAKQGTDSFVFVPQSSDITVIYTGEDGTVSTTTLANDGSMVTIENPTNGGAPVVKVDMMNLFSKAIPKTDLSTYL